jgi:hypothetical protein
VRRVERRGIAGIAVADVEDLAQRLRVVTVFAEILGSVTASGYFARILPPRPYMPVEVEREPSIRL